MIGVACLPAAVIAASLAREYSTAQAAHNERIAHGCDADVIDLPPDAVRTSRTAKLIGVDLADGPDRTVYFVAPVEWSFVRIECDSDGGECD